MTAPAEHMWPDPATIMTRSLKVFLAQWQELLRLRRLVIKTADHEDIHDLRVAARRFTAALKLFYPLLPNSAKAGLRNKVRELVRTLGELRNVDEALLFFQSQHNAGVSTNSKLRRALAKLRIRELKRVRKLLASFDQRQLNSEVHKIGAKLTADVIWSRSGGTAPAYFSGVCRTQYQPIPPLLEGAAAPEHRATRHALRIAIKKWRYLLEILALILERDYAPFVNKLKEYQSVLGSMNDIAEFERLLGRLKLPPAERKAAEATLKSEDARLLASFTAHLERIKAHLGGSFSLDNC